jgi:hypothetical protein
MPSVVSSRSQYSKESLLEDALFLLPKEEDFPLIDDQEVWSESQAFHYVLDELLGIDDEPTKEVIMRSMESITGLKSATDTQISKLKIPSIDPESGRKIPGGEPISETVVTKLQMFRKFYCYLDQYKFPGIVSPPVWQAVITKRKYDKFRAAYGTSLIIKDGECKCFHPIKKVFVTPEDLMEIGNQPRPQPKPSSKGDLPTRKPPPFPEITVQEDNIQDHEDPDFEDTFGFSHGLPKIAQQTPSRPTTSTMVDQAVLQFQRTIKRDKANYLDLSSDDYWEPFHRRLKIQARAEDVWQILEPKPAFMTPEEE